MCLFYSGIFGLNLTVTPEQFIEQILCSKLFWPFKGDGILYMEYLTSEIGLSKWEVQVELGLWGLFFLVRI